MVGEAVVAGIGWWGEEEVLVDVEVDGGWGKVWELDGRGCGFFWRGLGKDLGDMGEGEDMGVSSSSPSSSCPPPSSVSVPASGASVATVLVDTGSGASVSLVVVLVPAWVICAINWVESVEKASMRRR